MAFVECYAAKCADVPMCRCADVPMCPMCPMCPVCPVCPMRPVCPARPARPAGVAGGVACGRCAQRLELLKHWCECFVRLEHWLSGDTDPDTLSPQEQ